MLTMKLVLWTFTFSGFATAAYVLDPSDNYSGPDFFSKWNFRTVTLPHFVSFLKPSNALTTHRRTIQLADLWTISPNPPPARAP